MYISLGKGQPTFCPSHWIPYAGHCYYLQRTKKMWRDALAACHKDGGELASIHNIEEQSFIISQSGYMILLPLDTHWPMSFQSSAGSFARDTCGFHFSLNSL
ncbi:hypothetical protein J4Q44_G00299460 [Coregonus suidteri]|uniref:C-type lectin domain-containing protein n=1 Tax=Coregonus suidteri TaxID=861788 RepID=A0AAN8QJQ9_9TELE